MDQKLRDKIEDFFADYPMVIYQKGEILTLANEDPKGILFLVDGVVEQYDITPEGNKVTVNIFKPSTFFPMSWAINKTPNVYFYEALTDVRARQATPGSVVAFLQANPDILFNLMSRVYKGTDALLKRLVLASSGVASSRLAFELLIEAYRFGVEVDEGRKLVKIKQSQLAARSGLARETVSRELHKLEKDNLVILNKQGIILEISVLERRLDIGI